MCFSNLGLPGIPGQACTSCIPGQRGDRGFSGAPGLPGPKGEPVSVKKRRWYQILCTLFCRAQRLNVDHQENGKMEFFSFRSWSILSISEAHQVFQAHQAFQEPQAKMDCQVFQVLKVNVLLVKQVRRKYNWSSHSNFFHWMQASKELLVNQVFRDHQDYPELLENVELLVLMVRKYSNDDEYSSFFSGAPGIPGERVNTISYCKWVIFLSIYFSLGFTRFQWITR